MPPYSYDDVVVDHDGENVISGGHGDDDIAGLAGDDMINGGVGYDTAHHDLDYANGGQAGISGSMVTGVIIDGFGHTDSLISIETVIGTRGDDRLEGGAGQVTFPGSDGDDLFISGTGNGRLLGGAGVDTISLEYATGGINFNGERQTAEGMAKITCLALKP